MAGKRSRQAPRVVEGIARPQQPPLRWSLSEVPWLGSDSALSGFIFKERQHNIKVKNKDLPYSTGNSLIVVWQPGWEGGVGENGYMYMYG